MSNHLYDAVFAPNEESEKSFLITPEGSMSYAAFHKRVNQLAHALMTSGMTPGDRVAVQAAKSTTQLALYV
ncbi:MAG: AMP-binding protein, partial [Pseudomonadota bacterium]|nr:AMP-binding protein [Pseudomonadota bacterium]